MRYSKPLRAATAMLAILLTAACAGSMFRQPVVTLENVQVGGLGLRGGTLLVNIQVVNPNSFSLNANELRYELALRDPGEAVGDTTWIDFAAGTYDQPFSVAGNDSATVQIPVEFSYSGLGAAAGSLMRAGTFTYRATGTVDVRTPLGTHAVPFRKRGVVTLMGTR